MYGGDLREFAAPPFDTITPEQEARLKENRYNITFLTLPERFDGPESARKKLQEWIRNDILIRSEKDMFIVLVQEFKYNGEKIQRIGVIGLANVYPDDGTIMPHEGTFEGAVRERVDLLSELCCHLEPIFLALMNNTFERNLKRLIWGRTPDSSFEEPAGVTNYVYHITDEDSVTKIKDMVSGDKAIVADGHHRLKATRTIAEKTSGKTQEFWSNTLSYVSSIYDRGLMIAGMHKLIGMNYRLVDFLEEIGDYFDVSEQNNMDSLETIKIYNGKFYNIIPKKSTIDLLQSENAGGNVISSSLVTEIIFRRIMKMNYRDIEASVRYTPDLTFAVSSVDRKESSFAVIMPSWNKELFLKLALNGSIMPQKSTYFYPKIPSGIAINSLH